MTVTEPRSLLYDGRFRTYWLGQAISQFGDRITELALPLIAVTMLAASPGQVGLLNAAVWLPTLVSLVVGSWVDHQQRKRRILVVADLARAVVLVTLPLAYVFDAVTLAQLFAVALLTGLGSVFYDTAYSPVFVNLVPRESFMQANSLFSSTRSASFIAGPAVGGVLIQVLTAPVALLADAVSFVVSAVLTGRIPLTEEKPRVDEEVPLWRRSVDGMRFLLRHRILRASLACCATGNFFAMAGSALLVLFASRTLGLSAGLIGTAFAVGAAGGLVGALLAPRLARGSGVGLIIMVGAVVYPSGYAVAALAGGPTAVRMGFVAAAEFVTGVGVMLFDVNLNSLQACVIPDELRSRVSGAFTTINYGVRPLGAVAGGVLGTALGVRATLLIAAVGGALAFLWLVPSPIAGVRRLEDLDAIDPYTGSGSPLPPTRHLRP
jgi:MFS family permease